jgi:ATP-dependent helicase/DNAse subunit B
MQHSLQYARDYLTRLGAGCFPVNPATPDEQAFDPCRYCRSKGICGIEKQRIEGPVYATFEQLVQQHRGKEAAAAARKIKKNDRLAYLLMQTYGPGHAEGTSEGEEADHEVYG